MTAPETSIECANEANSIILPSLNSEIAYAIGSEIISLANVHFVNRPVAIQIETDEHPVFAYFMDGTGSGNVDWINKKRNIVRHFGKSSWAVKVDFLERGADFAIETGLDPDQYRAEGGAIPLNVEGKGRVGTLIVSGLHGWEDHALAVAGLKQWLANR